ncbi:DUF5615 family PIN-like protein [Dactylococcopsis salina]|uniref:DUF5615 domain-containing protein n=1 Tax=Dactylococcopsis salina (strain PCC 8305) TaxID=13035 RepID=K9YQP5_DACS8|nr:DUF5615 family PIN-like protein [Dactylococcopsis salina]AFZ49236.1 hypothetical protein Dacsa_0448 [Dactylococcopsis salina PCC 8305]
MLSLYFDEDSMDQALIIALRARGVDVISAADAEMLGVSDLEQLDYAKSQKRVLFSFNRRDFYRLHGQYLAKGKSHQGIILAKQQRYSIGQQLRQVLEVLNSKSEATMINNIVFLS